MSESKRKTPKGAAELAELFPGPRRVVLRENVADATAPVAWRQYEALVDELPVAQLAQVAKIMSSIIDSADMAEAPNIIALAAEHAEAMFEAVGIAINESPARVAKFSSSGFIDLVFAIYEVNRDFFVRSLGSRAAAAMATVSRMTTETAMPATANGAGSTPSPSFASTAESPIRSN